MSINYTTLLTGALGFTVALAWNDAINRTIRSIYPPSKDEKQNTKVTIAYALIITLMVVIIVALINHTRKFVHRAIGYEPRPETLSANGHDGPGPGHRREKQDQLGGHGGSIIRLWEPPRGSR